MLMNNKLKVVSTVAAGLLLAGCGVSTTPSTTKLRVGDGMIEDPVYKECIPAGERRSAPTNDAYYSYPLSERDLDMTGQDGGDLPPITVVSKDNVTMAVPIRLAFNMVTDCKSLQEWHTAYGERYQAFLEDDGTTTEGWLLALRKIMADPLDARLDEIAKNYDWIDLYNQAEAQNEVESAVRDGIEQTVDSAADGHYFEDFNVLVKKPVPTDRGLLQTINRAQKDFAAAEAKIRQAEADERQAQAELNVAQARAKKKAAEIAGYGSFDNYLEFVMVNNGLNPKQPSYIVSDTRR
jgi:regulator of protease activity HflC (stomatin/prohibitin superfamily)